MFGDSLEMLKSILIVYFLFLVKSLLDSGSTCNFGQNVPQRTRFENFDNQNDEFHFQNSYPGDEVQGSQIKMEMFRYCGTKNFITKNLRTFLFQFKDIHNIPIM